MVIWAHSYVLRYAPSGALAVVYRVRERARIDATRDQILAAEAYEHLGSMTAGACALLLGFAALRSGPPLLGLLVAVPVIVVAFAVRPRFLGRWVQAMLLRFGIDTPILRGRQLIVVVVVNLVAWIATGLGFLVLLDGLTDEPSPGLIWRSPHTRSAASSASPFPSCQAGSVLARERSSPSSPRATASARLRESHSRLGLRSRSGRHSRSLQSGSCTSESLASAV